MKKIGKIACVRLLSAVLTCLLPLFALVSCAKGGKDISKAESTADLAGARIAAQSGTFHAEALAQIKNVKASTYPEFADLLTALQSGAIDGYIAEEPTAFFACVKDKNLDYLRFKNNENGFTATERQTGIAIAVKKGSPLKAKISEALGSLDKDTRYRLMLYMVQMSGGEGKDIAGDPPLEPGEAKNPEGTLKIAMECAYEPFNWTDLGKPSEGAVPIYGAGGTLQSGRYANGYDVRIARYVAEKLNMKLEIYALAWDSLIPAVKAGTVDAVIAGMSPTPEREIEVDFSDMYYVSDLVVIYKK